MNTINYSDNLNVKKTGYSWTKIYSLRFKDIAGFDSEDAYNTICITAEDFLNRASCCTLEKPANISRRDASKLKRKLIH